MKDNEIFEHIKSAAVSDAPDPDFENLKNRISSLPSNDTYSEEEGFGYGELFPSKTKKSVRIRYAAAAAVIVAAAGLGAAFAGNAAKINEDTMSVFEMYDSEVSEESFDELYYTDNTQPSQSSEPDIFNQYQNKPDGSPETEPAITQSNSASVMPDNDTASDNASSQDASSPTIEENAAENNIDDTDSEKVSDVIESEQNSTASYDDSEELYDYYIKNLGATVGIPYYAFCTGPDVPDNFPPLEQFDITAEQLENNYKSSGICFNAVWFDDEADVVEIVVSNEDVSKDINNLSALSEYELEQLRQSFLSYGIDSPDSPRYYDVSVVNMKGQPYIRALGRDYTGRALHAQYMTIVNGQRVKLSLIEHYNDTSEELPEDGVSQAHLALIDSVAASLRYDHIRSEFVYKLSRLRPTVWVSLLGIVILLIYGLYYLIGFRKHSSSDGDHTGGQDYDAEVSADDHTGHEYSDIPENDDGMSGDDNDSSCGDVHTGTDDPEHTSGGVGSGENSDSSDVTEK